MQRPVALQLNESAKLIVRIQRYSNKNTHTKRVNVTVEKPIANSNDCPLQMRHVEQHGKTRRQNPKEVSG